LYYNTGRVEVVKRARLHRAFAHEARYCPSTFRANYANKRNTLEWFHSTHDFRFPQKN
jgi:hypothetical protein